MHNYFYDKGIEIDINKSRKDLGLLYKNSKGFKKI